MMQENRQETVGEICWNALEIYKEITLKEVLKNRINPYEDCEETENEQGDKQIK